jgi:hypothetical protein
MLLAAFITVLMQIPPEVPVGDLCALLGSFGVPLPGIC